MIFVLLTVLGFQAVETESEVTTSNGKRYRVETCFRDPQNLSTRFRYPDRTATFAIEDGKATTSENNKAPEPAGEREKAFAFGHNFHAIHYNWDKVVTGARSSDGISTGTLTFGGEATRLTESPQSQEKYRFDLPGTTPVEWQFSDWREGRVPYRLTLSHAGVTYDYRFKTVKFAC